VERLISMSITVAPDISGAVRIVCSGTLFFVHTPFYYLLRRLLQQELKVYRSDTQSKKFF
jgi:hypothetical protein